MRLLKVRGKRQDLDEEIPGLTSYRERGAGREYSLVAREGRGKSKNVVRRCFKRAIVIIYF